jgi:hypothetical protein
MYLGAEKEEESLRRRKQEATDRFKSLTFAKHRY